METHCFSDCDKKENKIYAKGGRPLAKTGGGWPCVHPSDGAGVVAIFLRHFFLITIAKMMCFYTTRNN
jgi:hypothetical protein